MREKSFTDRTASRLARNEGMALMSSIVLTVIIASAATLFSLVLMTSMMAERNVATQNDFQAVLQNLRVILGDENFCAANLHFDSAMAEESYNNQNDIYNVRNFTRSDMEGLGYRSPKTEEGMRGFSKNFVVITKPSQTQIGNTYLSTYAYLRMYAYLRTGGITSDGNWRILYLGFSCY